MEASTKVRIEDFVKSNRVMLFMKGTPDAPQCGFSAKVVEVLNREGAEFESLNVLADPEIRDGIKEFSDWPTIPQLYIDGEFVGGCDIVIELYESGDLKKTLTAPAG
ncbi:MAG: Grx4 family monothiol glutaredoxin [Verrucomicrobia bacterium]|nr:Grx4 family monothiol glutaredoxin [Verrucomicrobiota bacterium]MDA1087276.1 Grx4 family monothiol glutaredoxin [Verrucomicrobiota bacterium]